MAKDELLNLHTARQARAVCATYHKAAQESSGTLRGAVVLDRLQATNEFRSGAYDGAREHIARTTVAPTKLKKFVIEERH
ncbi:hypothetical protein [Paraburkholderia terrae]